MAPPVWYRPLTGRARLALRGPDRKRFLHGMITNDVNGLGPGQGCHAAMLTVKGKMLTDLVVHECGDDGLLLEMEGLVRDKIRTALDRHLIMDDLTIVDLTDELDELGVYGAGAAALLGEVLGAGADLAALPAYHHRFAGGVRVARSPELGLPGYHLFASPVDLGAARERLADLGALPLSEEEAEVLRVEAGVPRYGADMDEERLPIEANMEDAVSFQKGCYLGQEVIARVTSRGHVNRRLLGLRFPAGGPPPPPGTPLCHESRQSAGTVMTGVVSPRHGTIALGYVHRTLWEPGTALTVGVPEGGAGPLPQSGQQAVVTPLPFSEALAGPPSGG